ncbi:MAG: leucine-rich repeat domain-containing protein [Clostridia bacterium]|nr:leucine-rich repeat domain-containing protein [Clostridia bacterium]
MRTKFLKILIIFLSVSAFVFTLTACSEKEPPHNHQYTKLKHNETQHWYECSCGAYETKENHKGGTATETSLAVCSVCNEEYGELKETEGLQFTLINNNTEYEVSGCNVSSTKVDVPTIYKGKHVTSIGAYAFSGCTSLTSIDIPNSVTSIDAYAFSECSSLTSIVISNSVKSIGAEVFYNCESLTNLNYTGTIDEWTQIEFSSFNSNPLKFAKHLYIKGELVKQVNITTVTKINDYAFYNCSSLTSVVIGDSVKSIGTVAFSNCSSLTSVKLGKNLTSIGVHAFSNCLSLTSIIVDENNGNYKSIDCNLYSKDGRTLIKYAVGNTQTSFAIPNGVTSIGDSAFSYCTSLTSIEIPNDVTYIGDYAFLHCTSLTSIIYHGNVEQWYDISKGYWWDVLTGEYKLTYNLAGEETIR